MYAVNCTADLRRYVKKMEEKIEAINLDKIDRMTLFTFKNAIRLHLDSISLFNNKSYASAYYLSMIALEELGKIFLLSDFIWNSRMNGRYNSYKDKELVQIFGQNLEEGYFKKIVYNHKIKQSRFVRIFDNELEPSNKYFKKILEGGIENEKQNSLYVDLKRNGKKIDMTSKIINPLNFNKNKASLQIAIIQKCLLELTLMVSKKYWTSGSDYLDDYLSLKLYRNLKQKWPLNNQKFIKRLQKIENRT